MLGAPGQHAGADFKHDAISNLHKSAAGMRELGRETDVCLALPAHRDGWMQDEQGEHREAEASARRAVQLMEAEFGEENPRNATAYGTLAAILK